MSKLVTKDTLQAVAQTIYDNYVITADFEGDLMDSSDTKDVTNIIDPYYEYKQPLTLNILTGGTVYFGKYNSSGFGFTVNHQDISYKINDASTWTTVTTTASSTYITVNAGDKVYIGGNGFTGANSTADTTYAPPITSSDECTFTISGNIMSLLNKDNFVSLTTLTNSGQFAGLFLYATGLIDSSNLLLPATTITNGCYHKMFFKCTSMEKTFKILPATVLINRCYKAMYKGCSLLKNTPVLPASTLVNRGYQSMFSDCSLVNEVEIHATGGLSETYAIGTWLDGVAETGTFKKISGVTYPEGSSGIPTGWTVVNINE